MQQVNCDLSEMTTDAAYMIGSPNNCFNQTNLVELIESPAKNCSNMKHERILMMTPTPSRHLLKPFDNINALLNPVVSALTSKHQQLSCLTLVSSWLKEHMHSDKEQGNPMANQISVLKILVEKVLQQLWDQTLQNLSNDRNDSQQISWTEQDILSYNRQFKISQPPKQQTKRQKLQTKKQRKNKQNVRKQNKFKQTIDITKEQKLASESSEESHFNDQKHHLSIEFKYDTQNKPKFSQEECYQVSRNFLCGQTVPRDVLTQCLNTAFEHLAYQSHVYLWSQREQSNPTKQTSNPKGSMQSEKQGQSVQSHQLNLPSLCGSKEIRKRILDFSNISEIVEDARRVLIEFYLQGKFTFDDVTKWILMEKQLASF